MEMKIVPDNQREAIKERRSASTRLIFSSELTQTIYKTLGTRAGVLES